MRKALITRKKVPTKVVINNHFTVLRSVLMQRISSTRLDAVLVDD